MAAQKQILESIRDIIGGNDAEDEEVLDLTDIIEAPKGEPIDLFKEELTADKEDEKSSAVTNDVLREIDALLAEDDIKEELKKPAVVESGGIELADFIKPELAGQEPETAIEPESIQEAQPVQTNIQEKKMEKEEQLISKISAEEARSSLKTLMEAAENVSKPKVQTTPFRNGDTVEDLVMDMLKPILKEWLDNNLPALVQNIVEKEIKKLVPNS